MNILEKLVEAAKARVARDKRLCPSGDLPVRDGGVPFAFENALRQSGMSFICEVKKASPSKGVIAHTFPYADIAEDYEKAGAACISVLTETDYFLGRDAYLTEISERVSIPVLRKDFTVDPYQIYQAKAIGADAVLLICAILDKAKLKEFIAIADELGLSAVVEAHDRAEVSMAVSAGARVIGVNNRNLKTFEVDLQNSVRLRGMVPEEAVFISESGISTRQDIALLEQNGVDAVLIGETLMRSTDKKAVLDGLRGMA